MIDEKKLFWSANQKLSKHENIRKIANGQGDDYTTGCLTIIISKTIVR